MTLCLNRCINRLHVMNFTTIHFFVVGLCMVWWIEIEIWKYFISLTYLTKHINIFTKRVKRSKSYTQRIYIHSAAFKTSRSVGSISIHVGKTDQYMPQISLFSTFLIVYLQLPWVIDHYMYTVNSLNIACWLHNHHDYTTTMVL